MTATFGSQLLYAHNVEKQPFMTESYKTPISFNILRESDSFDDLIDVQSNEIVLITYANDNLYLTVPQTSSKKKGNEDGSVDNMVLKHWYDFRDVDLDGWFVIEYDQEDEKVHLKHFNTGRYLTVYNKEGINDIVTLEAEASDNSQLIFQPIDSEDSDVMVFTSDTIFKIISRPGEAKLEDSYLRVADEEDKKILAGNDADEDILELEATTEDSIPIVVKEQCPVNQYDTFNLVFPKVDMFRELMFCKDTNTYLKNFVYSIRRHEDPIPVLKESVFALFDIFWSIYAFLNNELEGTIKAEYIVGEVVGYRQKMISKIGISESIYEFLKLLTELDYTEDEDNWEDFIINTFTVYGQKFIRYKNLINLIFDTVYSLIYGNYESKKDAVKYIMTLQKFVFVEKLPVVLSIIFKRKRYSKDNDMNKDKMYMRIYEYDRIKPLIENYIKVMKKSKNRKYFFILRRLCVIDENPVPLIQDYVFNELIKLNDKHLIYDVWYKDIDTLPNEINSSFPSRLNSLKDKPLPGLIRGKMQIIDEHGFKIDIDEFCKNDDKKKSNAKKLALQFALEANIWYGRNKSVAPFFKEKYPAEYLITNITKVEIPHSVKAFLIRLLTTLYIDSAPYSLIKNSRCFRGYLSANDQNNALSEFKFNELKLKHFDQLFKYYNSFFINFMDYGDSDKIEIEDFEVEVVKSWKFMLKYGIWTHRTGKFQSDDLDDLFGFLCLLLDIFTKRQQLSGVQTLDSVAQKDRALDDYAMNNPLQKSAFDVRNWLFNKKDWEKSDSEQEIERLSLAKYRRSYLKNITIKEIMEMFHFLMDLRQAYLMNNLVEHFYLEIYRHYDQLDLEKGQEAQRLAIKGLVRSMKSVVINSDEMAKRLPYKFPSINYMYDITRKGYLNKLTESERIDMHDDFKMLIMDTFNVSYRGNNLKQNTLTLLVRYFSEQTEFIRNIEKMMLVFNDKEWDFYMWTNYEIDRFSRNIDKSSLWLNEDDDFDDLKYIQKVLNDLDKILSALYHKYTVIPQNGGDSYEIDIDTGPWKINEFTQRIYRNLKVYDHLVSFIINNKKMLKLVRTKKESE